MNFTTRVQSSRFVRLSRSSRFFMRAAASTTRASNSSRVSTFLLLTSLFTKTQKQKSNAVRSGDSNGTFSVTIQNQKLVHRNFFFLTMTDTVTSQNIDFSSCNILHKTMFKISTENTACRAFTLEILTG